MSKTYRVDEDEDLRPVDVTIRKRLSGRKRNRWDDEFREHQNSQTRDHRATLPVTRYREKQ